MLLADSLLGDIARRSTHRPPLTGNDGALLYFGGCPNYEVFLPRLRGLLEPGAS